MEPNMKEVTKRDILIYFSIVHRGEWSEIQKAILAHKPLDYEDVKSTIESCKSKVLTIFDPEYPEALSKIPSPPLVLYYEGDLSLIQDMDHCISMVGSRDCTEYARAKTVKIANELAKDGVSVVSGLATGIDTAAAEGAVKEGKAVAVLGNGLDYFYPSGNRKLQKDVGRLGLLLSEYPDGVHPRPFHFPMRNRIIAGLSAAVCIMQAAPNSGTYVTAALAATFGRDVGCLPFRSDEGNIGNALIQDGAMLIESAEDVYRMMKEEKVNQTIGKIVEKSYK
ncbi:MAG: DNA-protecting protein DprA [Erysipelotrichaceae bacterium]|nr:DNA-protecting protein DprA [Erysipelotrichaceae bacterium]